MTLNRSVDRRAYPEGATVRHEPARDNWPLRIFDWPLSGEGQEPGSQASECLASAFAGERRGQILFLGGRGDHFEKYLEAFSEWHGQGWRVTSFDCRGQGGSGRYGSDPMVGHIEAFEPWIDDLADRFAAMDDSTRVVIGHSMGGHLVLRALIERRITPAAAVLIAPMLGLKTPVPQPLALRVARSMTRIGDPARSAWQSGERPSLPGESRRALLTHCPERYEDEQWWRAAVPELAIGPPSWRWLALAFESTLASFARGRLESVQTPVLLLSADYDGLVDSKAIHRAAKRLPNARLLRFGREAAHELLREAEPVRIQAMQAIDRFLDEFVS